MKDFNIKENTLDYLLKIEAQAAELIKDAQAEAERRIHDNGEKCRTAFEEHYRMESEARELLLKKETEELKIQFNQTLDDYQKEISGIKVNTECFSSLLNSYLDI
jgi:vacuolar-type H+-ATPase subunit H